MIFNTDWAYNLLNDAWAGHKFVSLSSSELSHKYPITSYKAVGVVATTTMTTAPTTNAIPVEE